MRDGFLRVAAAVPEVNVAAVPENVEAILRLARELDSKGVEVAVFPELCITGYTCGDLFHNETLLAAAMEGLAQIRRESESMKMTLIVGLPVRSTDSVYNCAAVIERGACELIAKQYVPNYNEFYEGRWFEAIDVYEPSPVVDTAENLVIRTQKTIETHGARIGVEICEDLWVPVPPSSIMAVEGVQVVFNLSASDDLTGKYDYVRELVKQQSARCMAGYVYAGAGYGESSTDLVFDGKGLIAENGKILAEKERWSPEKRYVIADIDINAIERDRMHSNTFSECGRRQGHLREWDKLNAEVADTVGYDFPEKLYRSINARPFVPSDDADLDRRCTEIVNIQAAGLCRRLDAIHCKSLVVGISGGLDSTLALLVAVRAFDRLGLPRKGIVGVTMPGFGTTDRTHDNAVALMDGLGVSRREISIGESVMQHFKDIGHDPANHDVTYENSQARMRTMLLMDIANQTGGIVLGTGDLSELALGWATYNGDHMSMYGVNAGVPKTLVKYLVRWFALREEDETTAKVLSDIIDTPISPELIPADEKGNITQVTEDLVGPYELHDFFLYYMLRYGMRPRRVYRMALVAFAGTEYTADVIKHWMRVFYRRFFTQQFKRSCLPDGPKVGSVCLSPRGDWRMPSDASAEIWLREVDEL